MAEKPLKNCHPPSEFLHSPGRVASGEMQIEILNGWEILVN